MKIIRKTRWGLELKSISLSLDYSSFIGEYLSLEPLSFHDFNGPGTKLASIDEANKVFISDVDTGKILSRYEITSLPSGKSEFSRSSLN